MHFWHTWLNFLPKNKKNAQAPKTKRILKNLWKKKWFSSKNASGSADGSCVNLKKTCRTKVFYFWLQVQRSLKPCPNLEKKFLLKISQGYVDCRLWQLGPNFSLKIWKKSLFRILEAIAFFWTIPNCFSLIGSSGHLLQYWQPWKKFSPLSVNFLSYSLEPKILNNFFWKSCSVSNLLET